MEVEHFVHMGMSNFEALQDVPLVMSNEQLAVKRIPFAVTE